MASGVVTRLAGYLFRFAPDVVRTGVQGALLAYLALTPIRAASAVPRPR